MSIDRAKNVSGRNNRQTITAILLILVILFLIWQGLGLFRSATPTTTVPTSPPPSLKPVSIAQKKDISPIEQQMMHLQAETQAKYLAALNELQMLKISQEIAATNRAIAAAKLATISDQKKIIQILAPPRPTQPTGPIAVARRAGTHEETKEEEIDYEVVSISHIKHKWHAVLNSGTTLYSIAVGDILPADGAKVIAINNTSVTLMLNGVEKKLTLVSII